MPEFLNTFLQTIRGKSPRRPVWTADIEYWLSGREADGTLRGEWRTERGYLEFCRELRIMPYYWYEQFWLASPVYGNNIVVRREKDNRTERTIYETPLGSISEESVFVEESCSKAHTKFAVKTKDNLEVLLYIMRRRRLSPEVITEYSKRRALWREYDGIPAVAMPRSPLAAFFYEWAGVENGVYLLMDYPELIDEVFTLMDLQEENIIDAVCEAKPGIVHFADNMSADNMTGYYDQYMKPYHVKRLRKFHEADIPCAVHLDGTVRRLLNKVAEAGFDAVEALTPSPSGDMAVDDMRCEAGNDKVVLWGGVPGAMFSPPYTWKDMELHVRHVLNRWKGTPFILGVADQIPPDGDISFCPRIAKLIEEECETY